MWQRFTERARKAVFYAQEEARKNGEMYVSTEHLLLALTRENDHVAAQILERLGISLVQVRAAVEKHVSPGSDKPGSDMQLTPRAKRVIDLAYDEARLLRNNYIGTEHLLLGMVREGEGLAGRVLADLGVKLEDCRREVVGIQNEKKPDQGNSDELLNMDDAAKFLGVSKPTLYRFLSSGELKGVKVGRQWRFRKEDLAAYLGRESGTSEAPAQDIDDELSFFQGRVNLAGRNSAPLESEDIDGKLRALSGDLIKLAILQRASDIHIEPVREPNNAYLLIRLRVDGSLHELRRMPPAAGEMLVTRLKMLADLDISQKAAPQEGRIPVLLLADPNDDPAIPNAPELEKAPARGKEKERPPITTWDDLIGASLAANSSSLYLSPGRPPIVRIGGVLSPLNYQDVSVEKLKELIISISTDEQRRDLQKTNTLDLPYVLGGGRMRVNVFPYLDGIAVAVHIEERYNIILQTLPTAHGEAITMRIMEVPKEMTSSLEELGFSEEQLLQVREWVKAPRGIIVGVGPEGSGKTTPLYAMLKEIAGPGVKTFAFADPPVEIPYVTPIALGETTGTMYPETLRPIDALRAMYRGGDPDVVFYDIVKDSETARLIVEIALSGHLVLTTVEAASLSEAHDKFDSTEPLLLTRALVGVIVQRLALKICPDCKEAMKMDPRDIAFQRIHEMAMAGGYVLVDNAVFSRGRGCAECRGRGYRGRVGLFQVITWNDTYSQALLSGATAEEIERLAVAMGSPTVLADAIRKAAQGEITIDEAIRVGSMG